MQETIDLIKDAFLNVELGDGISLREARAFDDHGSKKARERAREKDELKNWENISYKDIEKYPGIIPFLDDKGILFHLPAYMIYLLENHNRDKSFNIEDDVIYSLTPSKEDNSWFTSRFKLIGEKHKKAIVAFLNWKLNKTEDKYDAEEIQEALDYWANA